MKKKFLFAINILLVLFFCFVSSRNISFAQENKIVKFSWGVVSSISSELIMIKEYDFIAEEEKEASYIINPETTLVNAKEISYIIIGDEVQLEYIEAEDNRVVTMITLDKTPIQQNDIILEMLEEEDFYSVTEIKDGL